MYGILIYSIANSSRISERTSNKRPFLRFRTIITFMLCNNLTVFKTGALQFLDWVSCTPPPHPSLLSRRRELLHFNVQEVVPAVCLNLIKSCSLFVCFLTLWWKIQNVGSKQESFLNLHTEKQSSKCLNITELKISMYTSDWHHDKFQLRRSRSQVDLNYLAWSRGSRMNFIVFLSTGAKELGYGLFCIQFHHYKLLMTQRKVSTILRWFPTCLTGKKKEFPSNKQCWSYIVQYGTK